MTQVRSSRLSKIAIDRAVAAEKAGGGPSAQLHAARRVQNTVVYLPPQGARERARRPKRMARQAAGTNG